MGGGSGSIPARNQDGTIKSVRQLAIEYAELEQKARIEKYRQQMNFPAEVERTSSINIGSSSQSTDEETSTSNKSNTYNRNSKRGTRLVRSV